MALFEGVPCCEGRLGPSHVRGFERDLVCEGVWGLVSYTAKKSTWRGSASECGLICFASCVVRKGL